MELITWYQKEMNRNKVMIEKKKIMQGERGKKRGY
jgi:hypothetical protein